MKDGASNSARLQVEDLCGRVLKDRYEVHDLIGKGGMAEVYKGRDTVLKRDVAIKVLLSQFSGDESFTQRFQTEAQAAAQLRSIQAVGVYDAGEDDGTYFIVMELVSGSNLKTILRKSGVLPPRVVVDIAYQVCVALKEAHAAGIVHRDVKSSNIMVTRKESGPPLVQIMDFGIAQAGHLGNGQDDQGLIMGTAHYISPEQAEGKSVTSASDLYSLGVVMYEASTGRLPFIGGGTDHIVEQHLNEIPIPPQHLQELVDDDLNDIILKAMEKSPEDRYQSAAEMMADLDAYLQNPSHPHRKLNYPAFWAIGFVRAPEGLVGTFRKIEGPCVIGRGSEADVSVPDQTVSRSHARLTPRGMFLEVEDLVSSNGTLVDGVELHGSKLCSAGADLDLGNVRARIGKG